MVPLVTNHPTPSPSAARRNSLSPERANTQPPKQTYLPRLPLPAPLRIRVPLVFDTAQIGKQGSPFFFSPQFRFSFCNFCFDFFSKSARLLLSVRDRTEASAARRENRLRVTEVNLSFRAFRFPSSSALAIISLVTRTGNVIASPLACYEQESRLACTDRTISGHSVVVGFLFESSHRLLVR